MAERNTLEKSNISMEEVLKSNFPTLKIMSKTIFDDTSMLPDEIDKIINNELENVTVYFSALRGAPEGQSKKIETAFIATTFEKVRWLWPLNLGDFETVHGMSRVVKLIPDKLATAICIYNEELSDPQDTGSFLIKLINDLAKFYYNKICADNPEAINNIENVTNYKEAVQLLITLLDTFKLMLDARTTSNFTNITNKILDLSDKILILCYVYMDFIHPTWISHKRINNTFSLPLMSSKEKDLYMKTLERNKLKSLFHRLSFEQIDIEFNLELNG